MTVSYNRILCVVIGTRCFKFLTQALNISYEFGRLKFGLSKKHTKFEKMFLMILTKQLIYLVNVKTMRKIFLNYVCFSESPNFNGKFPRICPPKPKILDFNDRLFSLDTYSIFFLTCMTNDLQQLNLQH